MKKLMIAFVAVALATVANAAVYQWQNNSGSILIGDGSTAASSYLGPGKTAYLVVASLYSQDQAVKDWMANGSSADVIAKLNSTQGKLNTATTISAGSKNMTQIGLTDASVASIKAADKAYFLIFNGDKMYVSGLADAGYNVVAPDEAAVITFGSQASTSKVTLTDQTGFTSSAWYQAAAVPEPTSGLLLLLGVAGLALRRRRA